MTARDITAKTAARGLDGLARRLALTALPPAAEAAAARAARALAEEIAAETGAAPTIAGPSARPLVRIADPAFAARLSGSFDRPGDPVLSRILLAFPRRPS